MFKRFFLVSILFSTLCFAITKDNIKSEMTHKIDEVLVILKDNNLTKDSKTDKIITLLNPIFDYTLMSRLSLGKAWKSLSKEQKEEFTKLFTKRLKSSYIDKLDLYTDEIVEVLEAKQAKKNRIILKTQLIGKKDKYPISYKFYKVKNDNNWLIYDVDLIGVSIIQTYRQQFSGFLRDKSFEELLANLKSKK